MCGCKVADQARKYGRTINSVPCPQVNVPQAPVLLGLQLHLPLMHVDARRNQLVLADAQRRADSGNQRDIRVGNAAFPFGYGRFRHIQPLSQLRLREPILFALGCYKSAESNFFFRNDAPISKNAISVIGVL